MIDKELVLVDARVRKMIEHLEASPYPSAYMGHMIDELKRVHNHLQRAAGALPHYPEVDE